MSSNTKKSYLDALETARRLSEETKFVDWWVLDKAYKKSVVLSAGWMIDKYEQDGYVKRALFNSGRRIYNSEWSDKNGNEKSV